MSPKAVKLFAVVICGLPLVLGAFGRRQTATLADDPVKELVGRLDLEKYKATIKSLTQFGDRRQGTDRNRAAIDWIEAQLKSYGCPTERLKYEYNPPPPPTSAVAGAAGSSATPLIASRHFSKI
jgi:ferredoxin-NADP reductase